ncbi:MULTISPECIES: glycosyltransferase family 2 protein [Chitinophagaceae]|uniref:glycosyltransferase family 2 protein n=1 Tax=Chitinophagaceae TaxID=563835 RepID=UPI000DEF4C21|nr:MULTISPECIES: glycosyltransferase family 2 protein [Chitinophagaceae]RPD51616.1 glycosyltransferase [Paracnuella aquatica]
MDLSITNKTKTVTGSIAPGKVLRKEPVTAQRPLRITIITVTYNSSHTIADTLESVKAQQYENIEHIVVDGASTDNTIDIVRSYEHVSKYISEKDMGLYDAMNKGVQLATGDIIGILNSDDVYAHPHVLSHVAEIFTREQTDTLYGDLDFVDPDNLDKVVRSWRSGKFSRSNFHFGWMPPHPTFFVRREVYEQTGLFNLSLRSAADYELMLRILFKHQYKTSYLKEVLVKMRVGGMSNGSWRKRLKANIEDRMAWKMNDLRPYFFTLYMKPMRKLFQFVAPYLRPAHRSQIS